MYVICLEFVLLIEKFGIKILDLEVCYCDRCGLKLGDSGPVLRDGS